jgi:hypothetical protein
LLAKDYDVEQKIEAVGEAEGDCVKFRIRFDRMGGGSFRPHCFRQVR